MKAAQQVQVSHVDATQKVHQAQVSHVNAAKNQASLVIAAHQAQANPVKAVHQVQNQENHILMFHFQDQKFGRQHHILEKETMISAIIKSNN